MNRFRTLRKDEIDCRVSQVKGDKGVTLLLYKDARCDQNILDETVGPMNWMRHHTRENANCIVSIWDDEKKMWIEKEDTGKESRTESEKGLASDSFKRACFNWGIGRELYTAPFIFIPAAKCNIKDGKCYDNFTVDTIEYQPDGQREIRHLVIRNEAKDCICFQWQIGERKAAPETASEQMKIGDQVIGPPAKSLKTLMQNAMLAYGVDKAPEKFDELLKKAGCTRKTMNEHYYDQINEWILNDIRNGSKGAA
jgi:hypothetical protein